MFLFACMSMSWKHLLYFCSILNVFAIHFYIGCLTWPSQELYEKYKEGFIILINGWVNWSQRGYFSYVMAGLGSQLSVLTSHPLTMPLIKSLFQFVPCRGLEVPWRRLGSCHGDVEVPGKRALPSSSSREALFLMTTCTRFLRKFNLNSVSTWKKKYTKYSKITALRSCCL